MSKMNTNVYKYEMHETGELSNLFKCMYQLLGLYMPLKQRSLFKLDKIFLFITYCIRQREMWPPSAYPEWLEYAQEVEAHLTAID